MPAGFSDSLLAQLRDPARELGYCVESVTDPRTLLDTAKYGDMLYLQPSVRDEGAGAASLIVATLRVRELARGKLAEAVSRPLVSLRFSPAEASSLANVLGKKIAENLRSQYVADLLLRSHPAGATVRTASGLEGSTPVEWVMPMGSFEVTLAKPGYLDIVRQVELNSPGQHTYELQLVKRRFYHSRFIYPALGAGVISLAAFALENHYYSAYQGLGAADGKAHPEKFGDEFHAAKNYERLGFTALGMAWLNLALCFTF